MARLMRFGAHVALAPALFAGAFCSSVSAQSFNLDFGSEFSTPDDTFGAAAGQTGFWFEVPNFFELPIALANIQGVGTSVMLSSSLPNGPAFFDNPAVSGHAATLLEDYLDLRSVPTQLDITGLRSGDYHIYTYAWAPDSEFFSTSVTINEESVLVGGAWNGTLSEPITHAHHFITLGTGDTLTINLFGLTKGTLSGMQIARVPAPGATAALSLGGCFLLRRRR